MKKRPEDGSLLFILRTRVGYADVETINSNLHICFDFISFQTRNSNWIKIFPEIICREGHYFRLSIELICISSSSVVTFHLVIGAGAQLIEDVEAAFVAATQHHARLLQQEIRNPSAHRLPSARELDLHVLALFQQTKNGPFIQSYSRR